MSIEETKTIEQATIEVNELFFPEVSEGDTIKYDEYWFAYENETWVEIEDPTTQS